MILKLILIAFYLALPAYLANMAPAPFYKVFNKIRFLKPFNAPVNKFLFGKNKTWQGILTGTILGLLTAGLQALLYQYPSFRDISIINYSHYWIIFGFLAGLGAMLGDLIASFFKRRFKMKPGAALPIIDQLDFIAGFLILTWWLIQPELNVVITIIVLTLILHPLSNVISWSLKIKKHPW